MKTACASISAVLLLAACGGSSGHTASGTSTLAQTPTIPTTSAASSTTAQTTTTPSPPPCTAADLALSYLGGQGATGHGELGFELRNTSGSTCHTFGYPGVLFLDRSGAALPTLATRTTQDYFGSVPEVRLTVGPSQALSFRLGVTHGIASTAGCTTAYGLQVIAPDDTRVLHAAIPGGAYECRAVSVSPLRPGTTAYP